MQGKRFIASSMRLALKMIREELGPDAIILSNKQVPEGVELITAADTGNSAQSIATDAETKTSLQPSRQTGNPFVQDEALNTQAFRSVSASSPSRLELEVEKIQQQARLRAQQFANVLAQKNVEQATEPDNTISNEHYTTTNTESTLSSDARHAPNNQVSENHIPEPENHVPEHQGCTDTARALSSDATALQSRLARTNSVSDTTTAAARLVNNISTQPVKSDELAQMRNELQAMRDLLEQQLSSMAWGQFTDSHPQKASLWRRLKRMGIGANVANSLLGTVNSSAEPRDSWQTIMENLSRRLPVTSKDLIAQGGVFAFVGPTGAGKTTTIAKLAAQYVLNNGAAEVALVTTDTVRIAAQEQLRTVARILNVPVKSVDKNTTLDRILYSLRHKSLVLIDTAGLNRTDVRLNKQLSAINELGSQAKSVLVIPATSQVQVIKAAYHTYKTDNLCACVLTKLDETASLGESICLAVEKSLPVAYSTNGQNIPEDIAAADDVALVKTAIRLAKHIDISDDAMADEMTSLSESG